MTLSKKALSKMTLSKTALSKMTISIKTPLSKMTFSKTALSKMILHNISRIRQYSTESNKKLQSSLAFYSC